MERSQQTVGGQWKFQDLYFDLGSAGIYALFCVSG